jgi:hypothetical protein
MGKSVSQLIDLLEAKKDQLNNIEKQLIKNRSVRKGTPIFVDYNGMEQRGYGAVGRFDSWNTGPTFWSIGIHLSKPSDIEFYHEIGKIKFAPPTHKEDHYVVSPRHSIYSKIKPIDAALKKYDLSWEKYLEAVKHM